MSRKSILFVIPWLPYPAKSGGHQGLLNGIVTIKDDFDVFIAYETHERSTVDSEREFLNLVPNAHLLPLRSTNTNNLFYKFLRKSAQCCINGIKTLLGRGLTVENEMTSRWLESVSPLNPKWLDHINGICKKNEFDIIQVEMPWLISQVLSLPQNSKKIFVHHELGFVCRDLELSKVEVNEYTKAFKAYVDLSEISLLNLYDAIITVSPVDRKKLIEKGVRVPVYSSFSIIELPQEIHPQYGDGKHLVFVGPDSHIPNFVGVTWFIENCWARLKSVDNSYRLSVIGEWKDENVFILSSKYPGVEFLGYVTNLAECMSGAIMIVPITIGSGIRMKILEACSLGVPFVSTSVGAEGIPVIDKEHCLIADTPELFVEDILKMRDVKLQISLAKNARRMVEEHFSREALLKNRVSIYQKILKT